jgi:hypothetical protein
MAVAGAVPGGRAGPQPPALMLAIQRNKLDLWRLAAPAGAAEQAGPGGAVAEGDPLDLAAAPAHAARIGTAGGLHVACGAIARGGGRVACSDARRLRVFALEQREPGGQLAVQGVRLGCGVPPATCMAFGGAAGELGSGGDGSGLLLCADAAGTIRAVDLEGDRVAAQVAFRGGGGGGGSSSSGRDGGSTASSSGCDGFGPEVRLLVVSPDGALLAAAGRRAVRLFRLPALQPAGELLRQGESGQVTAMAFTGDGAQLAVVAAGSSLEVYDVQRLAPTPWSLQHGALVQRYLQKLPGSLVGLAASPSSSRHEVIVYTHGGMSHFDLDAPVSEGAVGARRQRQRHKPQEGGMAYCAAGQNGRVLPLPEFPCLYASYLAADAALLVEQPWEQVLQRLPAPLYRQRYGS